MPAPSTDRGTSRGYHTVTTYHDCPRKYFLRYVSNIVPRDEKTPQLLGKALHEAIRVYLDTKDPTISRAMMKSILDSGRWFEPIDEKIAKERAETSFAIWLEKYSSEAVLPWILEEQLEAKLPDGMGILTGRPDRWRIVDSREVIILDTKVTGYSVDAVADEITTGDQATCYMHLVRQNLSKYLPDVDPSEVIIRFQPDIIYTKPKVPTLHRDYEVIWNEDREISFLYSIMRTWDEIRRSMELLDSHEYPEHYCFPRHPHSCTRYGMCEYNTICRKEVIPILRNEKEIALGDFRVLRGLEASEEEGS